LNAARRIAMVAGFATWLFSFSLLHDARARFDGVPGWLAGILGVALIMTIGTAVTALIRLPVWPWCAIAGAVFVVAGVIGIHFVKLKIHSDALIRAKLPGGVSLAAVFRDIFQTGGVHVFFFIAGPVILLAAGGYGWLRGPRSIFAMDDPHMEGPHAA
jgi:hypothetical protein